MTKKVALIILDGWGNGKPYDGNAIYQANTPNFDDIVKQYPGTSIKTSGLDVGLPEGQMGNSEVGHMNLGAGRVVYQQLVLINKSFKNGDIYKSEVLINALNYAKLNRKNIHLIGLVSDGGVHSSIEHLLGLCNLMQAEKVNNFYVHAFTDGRDTDPKNGKGYLTKLISELAKTGGKLASVCGRYYAMDRDKRWDRVKLAYDCMVNAQGEFTNDVITTLDKRYTSGETDEFIKPIICVDGDKKPIAKIAEGDVVICFNFRTDRGREITEVLTQVDMPEQNMHKLNLHYITLTEYDKTYKNIGVVFAEIDLQNTLGEVLEQHNKTQTRIAETEKYPHVTFFFSGGRELPFKGESRYLAPSPKVATYDLQPEMSAEEVCNFTINAMTNEQPDFMCVNFANPDMVGHTGIVAAEIKAVQKVDDCLGRIIATAKQNNYTLLVTADHGNGEYMMNEIDGTPNTAHTTNEVPFIVVNADIKRVKPGRLADVAPTILHLLGIKQPSQMTGEILVCE
ncbi:MAG: 2,3-bisphosphoglycerate-independent phosphoglycerate mutase [Bacteroidia bacterium]|nr:2,3-bisphosphoglycerate-independent phosphoglycerate mutase [Bacteroidia bacterium]MBP9688683.1 2,3-bisphosphoglycerate-independent phosphoglycerate mutase [Bacteroidia bacterium]